MRMPRSDFRTPRLYVQAPLHLGANVLLDALQTNHLVNVLRLRAGELVLVFNGRDGEWQATLVNAPKRRFSLTIGAQRRPQTLPADFHLLFAPLKHARLDYMVQKAVEMGASRLQPVITRHVQVARVNIGRMHANAIEAAQQCGILTLPEICAPLGLEQIVADMDPSRLLVFCDEDAPVKDPVAALSAARSAHAREALAVAVLIGPEGGFASQERAVLGGLANVVRLSLGPRILRADTAAVAALALVGAVLGDWR
jgi:16S rRNA (uracil1498-N3)-methyltransferase